MKKILLILLTVLLGSAVSGAYEVYVVKSGQFVQTNSIPTVKKSVSRADGELVVTYTFDSLMVVRDTAHPGAIRFEIDGFGLSNISGTAATPNLIERVVAAPGTRVVLDSYTSDYTTLSGKYMPATEPRLENDNTVQETSVMRIVNKMLPEHPVAQLQSEEFRGKSIARIMISPVQYNSSSNTIRIHKTLSYTLHQLEVDDKTPKPILSLEYCGPYLLYFVEAELDQSTRPADCEYLILTNNALKPAAEKFARWKNDCGYRTTIIARDLWTTTTVTNAVKSLYNSSDSFYYLVLMGDTSVIPSFNNLLCGIAYTTDFPYSCLDSSTDFVPDICVGRFPFSDLATMNSVIDKSIAYEKDPSSGMAKSRYVFCSYLQDADCDSVADNALIYYTHMACIYASHRVGIADRIFNAPDNVTPKYWDVDGIIIPMQAYMRRPNFNWDGDTDDVIAAFNNGCHMLLHRGHGNNGNWDIPEFGEQLFTRLTNTVYPVVFSINCKTGMYTESDNFSKELLGMDSHGCAAIIAPTAESWDLYNDAFLCGIMSSIWPNPGLKHKAPNFEGPSIENHGYVASIGEIMNQALLLMDETTISSGDISSGISQYSRLQKEVYHCLGDPGLPLFWDSNTDLSKSVRRNNCLSIGSGSSGVDIHSSRMVTIAFHDTITGEVSRQYGKEFFFEAKNPTAVKVMAFANGCRPAEIKSTTLINPNPGIPALGDVNIGENTLTVTVADVPDDSANRFCISVSTATGKKYESLISGQSNYSIDIRNTQPVQPGGFYVVAIEENGQTLSTLKVRK